MFARSPRRWVWAWWSGSSPSGSQCRCSHVRSQPLVCESISGVKIFQTVRFCIILTWKCFLWNVKNVALCYMMLSTWHTRPEQSCYFLNCVNGSKSTRVTWAIVGTTYNAVFWDFFYFGGPKIFLRISNFN